MIEVVSVKFKGRGKTYFFDPHELQVPEGVTVVVETSKGLELAECVQGNHIVTDERIVPPLRPVVRIATADDMRVAELGKEREREAFKICEEKIAEHGLDMKLVDVECNFEGNKMLFFFTSEGRVDFRELVKDLAGVFRTRIELRQIGVRDEAKMLGGLGMCGRPFCCSQFLDDFQPVSTKMAKTQSLSLNPTKISGSCGRLMCCLRYEQEAYEDLVKTVPKVGAFVETPDGYGNVTQTNLLRQKVKVHLDERNEETRSYDADQVAAVPGGRPKPGEPLPHVLVVKPKVRDEAEQESDPAWPVPLFAEDTAEEQTHDSAEGGRRRRSRGRSRGKKPDGQPRQDRPQGQNKSENQNKAQPPKGERGDRAGRGRKKPEGQARQDKPQGQGAEGQNTQQQPRPKRGRPNHRRRGGSSGGGSKPKAE